MATITIDRATRDTLHYEVQRDVDVPAFGHLATDQDVAVAMEERDRVVVCGQLLDALGWPERAEVDHYEIPATSAVAAWAAQRIKELEESFRENQETLRHQEAGHGEHYYCGCTQEEAIAKTRGYVQDGVRRRDAVAALMTEVSAAGVA